METKIYTDFYLAKDHQILHCSEPKIAFIQYQNFRLNLLTGAKTSETVHDFVEKLEELRVNQSFDSPLVLHLFYEFGYICTDLEFLIDENKPLALFIQYGHAQLEYIFAIQKEPLAFTPIEHLSFKDYKKKFNKVYDHLKQGNCYQLNLTMPFYFRFKDKVSPREFMQSLWADPLKVGAYAHGTYIESLDVLFFSNSPECLFQIKEGQIQTMPIKGTVKVEDEASRALLWEKLIQSQKDESELFMIIDLLRNDLTKIELNPAYVRKRKLPLHVPGLIHQYSVIESALSGECDLFKIIKALFPGGSVTGAPKKNVMKLTREIEGHNRGFYCGSTIFFYKNIKAASINIRSAEIHYAEDEIKYGAGGGITLLSNAEDEYKEALDKLKSFLSLFQ